MYRVRVIVREGVLAICQRRHLGTLPKLDWGSDLWVSQAVSRVQYFSIRLEAACVWLDMGFEDWDDMSQFDWTHETSERSGFLMNSLDSRLMWSEKIVATVKDWKACLGKSTNACLRSPGTETDRTTDFRWVTYDLKHHFRVWFALK